MKLISNLLSFLAVCMGFCGFWAAGYMEIDPTWMGAFISVVLLAVCWLVSAVMFVAAVRADWRAKEKQRARRAVRQHRVRKDVQSGEERKRTA